MATVEGCGAMAGVGARAAAAGGVNATGDVVDAGLSCLSCRQNKQAGRASATWSYTWLKASCLRRMLTVYLLVSFVLSSASAMAIEHPTYRRFSRSHDSHRLQVMVKSKYVEMRPGDSVTVLCKANGGKHISDIPFVTFYRRFGDDTVMPLTSSSYGVTVEAIPTLVDKHTHLWSHKTVKLLTLEPEFYHILDYGINYFYCKAASLEGAKRTTFFQVKKI